MMSMYSSNCGSRVLGGIQFDLFRNNDSSSHFFPSKYSSNHRYLANSRISSFNSWSVDLLGVGMNFSLG